MTVPFATPFIHPLLGRDDSWSAFRVEFAGEDAAPIDLLPLYEAAALQEIDQRLPWLLPASSAQPESEQLGSRPVWIFSADDLDQPATQAQESSLRQARCKVGLEIRSPTPLPATGTWDYLIIAASHARTLPPFALDGMATRSTLVASNVHSQTERQWMLEHACSMSTGEFLLARTQLGQRAADTTRQKLLQLLGLIAQDADTAALDTVFRQEAKLSYSLLRLVNSAAIAPRAPITSFAQAINLLGRRQLERWIQLLVYADPNNGQHPNPLLYKAALRGRLMERLAPRLPGIPELSNLEDCAFMIGSFSLLDILLSMPMPEILQQLPLTATVREALAHHAGTLGLLLDAIEAAENREHDKALRILKQLAVPAELFLSAQLDGLAWVSQIRSIKV